MTQDEFAKKYLNKSQAFWAMVLDGKRKLAFEDAEVVGGLLGTTTGLWAKKNGNARKRKKAWDDFRQRMKR